MPKLNWRNPADYTDTTHLGHEHWAWEFLRRNPDYQVDWRWFSKTWQALEVDGPPPERDFQRWRRDPRSYRDDIHAPSLNGNSVVEGEGERLRIECWMGIFMARRRSTAP